MNYRRLVLVAVLLMAGCVPFSCGQSAIVGQYGPYAGPFKQLRLANGDTLTVYRMKYWTFTDGSPPAAQLEYELPMDVDDTAAVRAMARRVWPVFVPYLDAFGLSGAIITATNFRPHGNQVTRTAILHHFGLMAHRASSGVWRLDGDTATLPPEERAARAGIFERNGSRVSTARQ